jgi:hypothetical protein
MKRNAVQVGGVYQTKVKGQMIEVRIDAARTNGGWDAIHLATGKVFRIKSPSSLQHLPGAEPAPATTPTEDSPAAPAEPAVKKVSAIEAAAKVLLESESPMTTKQMIEAMTAQGLWTSPAGKTPAQTLYSAILREIAAKGEKARFTKTDRGTFAANA